jgi:type IV pilus assembly protein PilA
MAVNFHPRRVLGEGRLGARGFTLVEMMVVVMMVGILATIGIVSFRKEVAASKASEAASVIQAIRAAEEGYRAENQVYLNVAPPGSLSSSDDWYPSKNFGAVKRNWDYPSGPNYALWSRLGARVTQPVQFGYQVNAGRAGDTLPTLKLSNPPNLGKATDLWYVIQARADADGDGVFCNVAATSMSQEIYFENKGE